MPAPKRSPTTFMPSISGPSITWIGRSYCCRASSVSSTMNCVMPFTSACTRRSCTVPLRQASSSAASFFWPLNGLGELDQALGRVGAAVEDHVLDALEQLLRDLLVDAELAGVDDAHRHAGPDRVVEERRVHRLAHRVVAAERERDVRHAARSLRVRQVALDPRDRLDVVAPVVVVLLDAGRDREDVRVEDDVLGREADLLREDAVAALGRSRSCARACRPGPSRRRPSRSPPRRSGARAARAAGTPPRLPSARSS